MSDHEYVVSGPMLTVGFHEEPSLLMRTAVLLAGTLITACLFYAASFLLPPWLSLAIVAALLLIR